VTFFSFSNASKVSNNPTSKSAIRWLKVAALFKDAVQSESAGAKSRSCYP
jgi:hypothetical protein